MGYNFYINTGGLGYIHINTYSFGYGCSMYHTRANTVMLGKGDRSPTFCFLIAVETFHEN